MLSRSRTSSEEIDPFHTVDGKQAPTRQTILSLALPLLIMPEKQSLHLCWCDLVLLSSKDLSKEMCLLMLTMLYTCIPLYMRTSDGRHKRGRALTYDKAEYLVALSLPTSSSLALPLSSCHESLASAACMCLPQTQKLNSTQSAKLAGLW